MYILLGVSINAVSFGHGAPSCGLAACVDAGMGGPFMCGAWHGVFSGEQWPKTSKNRGYLDPMGELIRHKM